MMKIKLVCPNCGSENIVRDGPLLWDVDTQGWVSDGSTYDGMTCNDCGDEFDEAAGVEVE